MEADVDHAAGRLHRQPPDEDSQGRRPLRLLVAARSAPASSRTSSTSSPRTASSCRRASSSRGRRPDRARGGYAARRSFGGLPSEPRSGSSPSPRPPAPARGARPRPVSSVHVGQHAAASRTRPRHGRHGTPARSAPRCSRTARAVSRRQRRRTSAARRASSLAIDRSQSMARQAARDRPRRRQELRRREAARRRDRGRRLRPARRSADAASRRRPSTRTPRCETSRSTPHAGNALYDASARLPDSCAPAARGPRPHRRSPTGTTSSSTATLDDAVAAARRAQPSRSTRSGSRAGCSMPQPLQQLARGDRRPLLRRRARRRARRRSTPRSRSELGAPGRSTYLTRRAARASTQRRGVACRAQGVVVRDDASARAGDASTPPAPSPSCRSRFYEPAGTLVVALARRARACCVPPALRESRRGSWLPHGSSRTSARRAAAKRAREQRSRRSTVCSARPSGASRPPRQWRRLSDACSNAATSRCDAAEFAYIDPRLPASARAASSSVLGAP